MSLWVLVPLVSVGGVLALVALYDITQRRHTILRNFPVIGHLRFMMEKIGPEMRQYVVASNREERPFNRDQRRWIYSSAKNQNTYFGFGTEQVVSETGHITIRHSPFPLGLPVPEGAPIPGGKIMGECHGRAHKFRPASVVNISAMSFGSLSWSAIEALNAGAALADCMHNTGEGGISECHRKGGNLVYQVGTGYFGCRDADGRFSMDALVETVSSAQVQAIEIKLSQGAKPGVGGLLPGAKVTPTIAAARGVPVGVDVASPSRHTAFSSVAELVDFVERVAEAVGGIPVGVKSAVGQPQFWTDLAQHMAATGTGPDFVTVDGSEGGTGAGPLVFTDHVALPFWQAFAVVHAAFSEAGLHEKVVFIGSGKLGFPAPAALALNLGVDLVNVAREPMMAIGCIQAQRCHTGKCPTGVATQGAWLSRGLDPTLKSVRLAGYIVSLRKDLLRLADACGVEHPGLIGADNIAVVDNQGALVPAYEFYGIDPGCTHSAGRVDALRACMAV
ncbi:MAG TPA: FMN-binding glutamate synthase family protein [Acidimicrobiaceae bacterium]|nr:FMN-binding glutamate synthase family protein [Acidimicrobiaceae bacterium]HCB37074.1 FMN-binding glutamate synthase family protein [Acidimicrobiaceae bacterium]